MGSEASLPRRSPAPQGPQAAVHAAPDPSTGAGPQQAGGRHRGSSRAQQRAPQPERSPGAERPASCPRRPPSRAFDAGEPERSSERQVGAGLPSGRTPAQALGSEGPHGTDSPAARPGEHRPVTHRSRSESRPGSRAPGTGSGTGPPVRWSPAPRPERPPGGLRRQKGAL